MTVAPLTARRSGAGATALILLPSTSTSPGKAAAPLPSQILAPRKRTGFIAFTSVATVRLILLIRHIRADAATQAGRHPRDDEAVDHRQGKNSERSPRKQIVGPWLAWLNEAPKRKQHDKRACGGQQDVAKHIQFTTMVPDDVNRQRKVCEHVSEDDGNGSKRASEAEVMQRRHSAQKAEPEDERDRNGQEYPHCTVGGLVTRMDFTEDCREQTFTSGIEEDSRLRAYEADERAKNAGDTGDVGYAQQRSTRGPDPIDQRELQWAKSALIHAESDDVCVGQKDV